MRAEVHQVPRDVVALMQPFPTSPPDLHLHTIRTLGEQLKQIEAQLDEAVAAAGPPGSRGTKSAAPSASPGKEPEVAGVPGHGNRASSELKRPR